MKWSCAISSSSSVLHCFLFVVDFLDYLQWAKSGDDHDITPCHETTNNSIFTIWFVCVINLGRSLIKFTVFILFIEKKFQCFHMSGGFFKSSSMSSVLAIEHNKCHVVNSLTLLVHIVQTPQIGCHWNFIVEKKTLLRWFLFCWIIHFIWFNKEKQGNIHVFFCLFHMLLILLVLTQKWLNT